MEPKKTTKPMERDAIHLKRHFDAEIIVLCVRWYLGRIDATGEVQAGDVVRLIPDLMVRGGQAWGAVFEPLRCQ